MVDFSLIKANYDKLTADIAALNPSKPVKIMAVTKTQPIEAINYAINDLGISYIGENRVQELLEKYDKLVLPKDRKVEIHLIGSLQTNKVKYIVDKVDMIQSLDSIRLAEEIDKRSRAINKIMKVLVEVNIGREEQKGGIFPEELEEFLNELSKFRNIKVCGLMTIAPKIDESVKKFKYFSETYQYFIDISTKNIHNIGMDLLSMGMSGSYKEAIAAHSDMIRVGSLLFGARK